MLVERGSFVAPLLEAVPSAATGTGRWIFLGGEAGVGKTSLVGLLLDELAALPHPPVVRRGSSDGVATPAPLGPVIEALPELEAMLAETTLETRPRLFREVRTLLAGQPTVLVLEDLHWADEATLELVRHLGRRLEGLPLLGVATFRDDEVGPGDRLTTLIGDLATTNGVARMHVPTLTLSAVAELVETSGSALEPTSLHRRTNGNPFFVTEVLAAEEAEVPATVRDAVRARVSRVSTAGQDVLAAAAVLGPGARVDLLARVAERPAEAIDECVQRGLLVAGSDAQGLAFRHDIARETVETGLAPAVRTRLHERALGALTALGSSDHHRLAHHAAESDHGSAAVTHAVAAAALSARLGAHHEAAEEYRLALRFADVLDRRTVADLHDRLSYECYLTDDLSNAIEERRQALALHDLEGDVEQVGAAQRWLSRYSWFFGRGEDSRRYADQAIATLEALAPGHELAMAFSNKAQLAMLAGVEDETVLWGDRAIALARVLGDHEVEAHALNNVGTALLLGSDKELGLTRLGQSLDIALVHDLHEHAARAYTNLGAAQVVLRRYAGADEYLTAGIAYCTDRDLDAWSTYMTAWHAASAFEQGRYPEARRLAEEVLRRPGQSPVSRIPALVVAGTIAVRGGAPAAEALLGEARDLAEATGEAQRIFPVALALAEAGWVRGDRDALTREVTKAHDLNALVFTAVERGELAWWLRESGLETPPDLQVSGPFGLMLGGQWLAAAAAWEGVGCPWWQAVSLAHSESVDDVRAAGEQLRAMGADATRLALLRDRHEAGLPVPRGPRARTRGNPAGLTGRELEVLVLLADGLTNAELSARLFVSPKTVDHHVSAILRKLGEANRSAAVAAARREGMLPNLGKSPDVPG
ncbi:AAA family ATPase [Marmoricola sp. URHB0036]|uniref:ATP-binding protein n=1 Tax=Marmoricola sp. URHB0036 TaxID=1298863 RepID=UPI000687C662|nr:LuxR family transcriptional regulator [Marmoricola sp. URHB0036]